MTLQKWLSQRILQLCLEKDISINKLAMLSELTQSTVDSIIQGKSRNPQIRTLIKIANGLEITISELLDNLPCDIVNKS